MIFYRVYHGLATQMGKFWDALVCGLMLIVTATPGMHTPSPEPDLSNIFPLRSCVISITSKKYEDCPVSIDYEQPQSEYPKLQGSESPE